MKFNFIFFGRLEKEKGFDLILELMKSFIDDERINFYVFGDGSLSEKVPSAENISFFGRAEKSEIQKYLKESNFSLMPSRFLETFGLSALESLQFGVPVVGFQKGGLKNFVFDELDISRQQGVSDSEKLINMVEKIIEEFSQEKISSLFQHSYRQLSEYTVDKWLKRFQSLSDKPVKRVLLVSDFIQKIGGIERYIEDVKEILENNGYYVEMFGLEYSGKITKFLKYAGIFISFLNVFSFYKLKRRINIFGPEIVWFHSVSRFLGHFCVNAVKKYDGERWMMYHDLGYFHPFPANVSSEEQIDTEFCLKNFLKMADTRNPLKQICVFGKYLNILLLRRQLQKHIDKHFVPSEFMVRILRDSYNIPEEKIFVLPHFLRESE